MSTTRIGRLVVDESIVNDVQLQGDTLTLSGEFCPANVADGVAIRDDLNALLANPDEPEIPVQWSEDETLDGMYQVTGGSVALVEGSYLTGMWAWAMTLRRVSGAVCSVESRERSATRTNDDTATALYWWSRPANDYEYPAGFEDVGAVHASAVRSGETGDVHVYEDPSFTDLVASDLRPVDDWYAGAVEVTAAGRPVIGRKTVELPVILSNGIERVTITNDGGSSLLFKTETFGTAWEGESTWGLSYADLPSFGGLPAMYAPVVVRVARNGPVLASVTLLSAAADRRLAVTLSLRRGERLVSFYAEMDTTAEPEWHLERDPGGMGGGAPVAVDAGFYSGADDDDGYRWVIGSADTNASESVSSTAFWIEPLGASPSWQFAIGHAGYLEGDPGDPQPLEHPEALVAQWLATGVQVDRVAW